MDTRYMIIGAVLLALVGALVYRRFFAGGPTVPLSEWFTVAFDDQRVTMAARPPGRAPWEQSFLWSEVERVCFKSEGALASDGIYIFTTQRPESFVVPTEAKGGLEFWFRVVERGLFPSEMAIKAASLPEGEMVCWPASK